MTKSTGGWIYFLLDAVRTSRAYSVAMANGKTHLKVINLKTLGSAGGKARAAKLTDAQRLASARKANKAKWDNYYLEHPERTRPKEETEDGAMSFERSFLKLAGSHLSPAVTP